VASVSRDTTMIVGRLTSFAEIFLERLCKFKISIFTNNRVLTSQRYIPLMGRDIFI
jgi:ABC-type iron transport system FetAB permease component